MNDRPGTDLVLLRLPPRQGHRLVVDEGKQVRPLVMEQLVRERSPDPTGGEAFLPRVGQCLAGRTCRWPGHDYGGSVITGVADRLPHAVRALVYVDAFVPDDGDSCYSMADDEQREWWLGGGAGVDAVQPLPFFDPRARPHPRATLLQRIQLTGNWQRVPVKHYVAATDWPGRSPFAPIVERVRADPAWTVHE
jgi:pimeloyl-ACP methyl ester carboxylesterase